ncbi:hypothetical protein [Psychroserpens algicola]|uniref:Outer membrane protein assembly factor BamE n=1 Tax=Psychroserpens algicola TaxID=1719034 RepID=A0ABT0H4F0_9FLAO|nr:hypothetical protein [Psychroserpens algicola]MCK8479255.1 hypothetical protein [Psychroserpens algicola]
MIGLKKYDKVLMFFFVAFVVTSSLTWYFEERFDEGLWHSNPAKRYKLADDIIDNKLLIGKTKEEIISLLGEPEIFTEDSKNYIIYKMGKSPSFKDHLGDRLIIFFDNNSVHQVLHKKEPLEKSIERDRYQ